MLKILPFIVLLALASCSQHDSISGIYTHQHTGKVSATYDTIIVANVPNMDASWYNIRRRAQIIYSIDEGSDSLVVEEWKGQFDPNTSGIKSSQKELPVIYNKGDKSLQYGKFTYTREQ
ncbi:hypothetical protein MKQ70_32485 [Chitinophaga sedimenti]|uniref:hypothetical protein n=1 Tax=Chitinophaga sedimenti TaxID=2033606 RepID=UPI002003BEC8|nr:hypothetical protein [Chitinophaga sedimenti]MCK7559435.1 hypothetical protein [Chitinophaga sedimenti]